jgi:ABC-type enterochelin transport system permease subunit
MNTLGLLILSVVICYICYKFWKKIIVLIIIGIVFGFIYVVSSVSNFITDLTKGDTKQETVQTEMVYEDTINQEYIHQAIVPDSTEFDYKKNNTKKE